MVLCFSANMRILHAQSALLADNSQKPKKP